MKYYIFADIIPSPPQNFRGTVVDGVHVSLLWEMPKYNAGKVTKFQIYYKKASARSEEYVKVRTSTVVDAKHQ